VIPRARHLQEERLFDSYLAERQGEAVDPPVAEHLADCGACARRYAELAGFMDTLCREGDAEANAIFTPERLRAQHQDITRRIALVGRPARVLSFPGRIVRHTISVSAARSAPRWVGLAAAAGLFIGVAVGASYQYEFGNGQLRSAPMLLRNTVSARGSRMAPMATRGTEQTDVAADAAFLSDLETALERPHTRELQAFDELTPHVREITDRR
jgi:predicted anti-sigma-YlaC factor YlaD